MNLITEYFDIWTTAQTQKPKGGKGGGKSPDAQIPHGIDQLRTLILELAVRGKLVPQDPNDEPASVLLEKIAQEKAQLVKDGVIKQQKPLPEIKGDGKLFELPKGWKWVRNGALFSLRKGKKPRILSEHPIGLPYLDIAALDRNDITKYTDDEKCPQATAEDILIVCDGSRSGLLLNGQKGVVGSTLAVIDSPAIIKPYLRVLFAKNYQQLNLAKKGAAIPHLDTKKLIAAVTALPPETEQNRIVTKVDELMVLCSQLEQEQTDSNATLQTLLATLLADLTDAPEQSDFEKAWQQIANQFDTLLTTELSIDLLKKAILQLAVMGKLVPQDPNDEPASVLLEKIAQEKAQLVKDGVIKQQKPLPGIKGDEKLFELPKGWKWVRFGDVLNLISDYHANGSYKILKENVELLDDEDFAIMLRTTNFSEVNRYNYKFITEDAYNFLAKSKVFAGDIIMNKIGDPGACFLVDDRGKHMSLAMNLFLLRTSSKIDSTFAYIYLSAQHEYIKSFTGGTSTQTITKNAVNNLLFPICPRLEQNKIVAKVDELTALCNALKGNINNAKTTQIQLADTIVEHAVK